MDKLSASDMKPFIGSRDYVVSREFYAALGWQINWDDGGLAELELGRCRFFLQNYYQREWCENSMLHLTVADANAWYLHVKEILDRQSYGAARVKEPKSEDYGAIVTYVWDPVGVLLHLAQPLDAD